MPFQKIGIDISNAMKLAIVDRAYILETGKITLQGTGDELLEDPSVIKAYLGGY